MAGAEGTNVGVKMGLDTAPIAEAGVLPDGAPPMPDVGGGEASSTGLPDPSGLSRPQRLVLEASAASDVMLRTSVAALLSAVLVPTLILPAMRRTPEAIRQHDLLAFYTELAAKHDATKSFSRPPDAPQVTSSRAHTLAQRVARGDVQDIAFDSSFAAVNPAMRPVWCRLHRNNRVRAQHWRHADGPRPTLCVVHGFMASAPMMNSLMFALPWFYRSGYDVVLYTMPFHGRRAEPCSPFSGAGFFSRGIAGFAEATAQAVHDLRSVMDYLESTGVQRIAITGMSLGGYVAALTASADDRVQAVVPNVPVVDVGSLVGSWFPLSVIGDVANHRALIDRDAMIASTAFHSPLNYPPLLPAERRLIIAGLGDRLAPPEQAQQLWRHWDRCAMHWFPGNHVVHLSQPSYLRRMSRFLHPVMFG